MFTRRRFLKGTAALAAARWRPAWGQSTPYFVYVGTYTARGQGIHIFQMDPATGTLTQINTVSGEPNPSFIAFEPHRRFLYALSEVSNYQGRPSGAVSAFAVDPATGNLTRLNTQPSEGRGPAHLSVDPTGRYVLMAHYGGGNVSILPIEPSGRVGAPTQVVDHVGEPGPNRGPQTQARAHMILPDLAGRYVLSNDLGLDRTLVYRLDHGSSSLVLNDPAFAAAKPGAGPRHLAFHPNGRLVYSINELDSTLTAFDYDSGRGTLRTIQTVPTLPANYLGINSTAQVVVHPSGRFVYGSNRGYDSIVVFAINEQTGEMTLVGHQWTFGETPRNFNIDPAGNFLFVANQNTDNIVTFRIDPSTGRLTPTGQFNRLGQPVCILFAPPPEPGNSVRPGVTFWANPNPVVAADASGLGQTTLSWNAPEATEVHLRLGAPDGPLIAYQGNFGSVTTGRWIFRPVTFYLQDVSGGKPLTSANTLGTVRVRSVAALAT
jgi:6-phosphogluconolactonase